jgi:hypothetical protein
VNIQKAIDFANSCLGYTDAYAAKTMRGIHDSASDQSFDPDSLTDIQRVLEEFLQKSYWIQVGRDLTGLFQWSVIVGQQGLIAKGASFEHGKGVGDIADAIFDACIAAKQMDRREP